MLKFSKLIQAQFDKMCQTGKLFRVKMSGQAVWDLYLASFNDGDDPKFRDPASSTHNCNLCKNFIRRYGNIVSVSEDNTLESIFDVLAEEEFTSVATALSSAIRSSSIDRVFFETFNELNSLNYEKCSKANTVFRLGLAQNIKRYTAEEAAIYGVVKANDTYVFNHLHLDVPTVFVDKSGRSVESIMGEYRDKYSVFERAMEEINLDTFILVKDLINQGSLFDGATHLEALEKFIGFRAAYAALDTTRACKDNWLWKTTYDMHERFAKFKNTLMGVLCTELAQGKDINAACQAWNKRVDPVNYMKAKAPFTEKQRKEAQKLVEEGGYVESFDRRMATLDDIKVSEILHVNSGNGEIKPVSMFDSIKPGTTSQHKRSQFDTVEEVTIEKFMKDILPTCTSVEAFLENRMDGNLVTMTTAKNPNSKPMFKWPNNFSRTFNGNLAGKSMIKEAVKAAGGKVDGVLRFSIMWSGDNVDDSDLDAHCYEPNGGHIYFGDRYGRNSAGNLDVDVTRPISQMPKGAVENITYPIITKMPTGQYVFSVNQFSARQSKGFKAEIAFGDNLFLYEYARPVVGTIKVATVTLDKGEFTIVHHLPASEGPGVSKEMYGLQSNNFHKVNLVCLSPNHWDGHGIGNKYYMFMLEGCKSPVELRSFHIEDLIPELYDVRRVLEPLADTIMVPSTDGQLSGLGFNATVHDELIVRLGGSFKRVVKIKF